MVAASNTAMNPVAPLRFATAGYRERYANRASGMDARLECAVREAAGAWDRLDGPGDPNTIDLYRHARQVEDLLRVEVPQVLPSKEHGVALVELVEQHLVSAVLLRALAPHVVAERAGMLVDAIARAGLLGGGATQSYVCALYAWHGCINMAKLLRRTYVSPDGEASYTWDQRVRGYAWIQGCWSEEVARGNPWVRYGVSLARLFEKSRKGNKFNEAVFEDWVPQDSPYWDP